LGRIPHLREITDSMKIQLVTPAPLNLNNGNKITAQRWAAILKKLGHQVTVTRHYDGQACDVLIALHARRSAQSIQRFNKLHPDLPLIVVLTGTDLYRDIRRDQKAKQSLELATRLIVLQQMALDELPAHLHAKTQVIYQSAESYRVRSSNGAADFAVCVIGHLREEKDPLRTALAVRRLPRHSRIKVTHIGVALSEQLGQRARAEAGRNPRYRWIGHQSHRRTRETLARSHLACITSKMEGSSNVLSEALASGVPVIASKIPGLMGTLGKNFAGYFSVGDTGQLTRLLLKAETDVHFYRSLKRQCARLAKLVQPRRELADWRRLLQELT
jgi:putative glycosyltransferase (TIGR04348 family)